jgi:hypothetical protein
MKVILKALSENLIEPQNRWWGYKNKSYQALMRYGECILAWNIITKEVVYKNVCTKTDKAGVKFAIEYLVLVDNLR